MRALVREYCRTAEFDPRVFKDLRLIHDSPKYHLVPATSSRSRMGVAKGDKGGGGYPRSTNCGREPRSESAVASLESTREDTGRQRIFQGRLGRAPARESW